MCIAHYYICTIELEAVFLVPYPCPRFYEVPRPIVPMSLVLFRIVPEHSKHPPVSSRYKSKETLHCRSLPPPGAMHVVHSLIPLAPDLLLPHLAT